MDFTVLLQGLRHSTEFMNYKTIESVLNLFLTLKIHKFKGTLSVITHACQNGRFLLYFQRTGPQLKISQQVTTNSNNINRYSRLNQSLHTKLNHHINKGYLLQAGAHPGFCRMM